MIRSLPLVLMLALVPTVVQAQRDSTRTGPCGDTGSYNGEDETVFLTPMFVEPEQAGIRADFGIVQQPVGTTAQIITDERICRSLSHQVREALRTKTSIPLRFNDVVPTYIRFGRYYYVPLGLKKSLPPGTDARLPIVIIDADTMTVVTVLLG